MIGGNANRYLAATYWLTENVSLQPLRSLLQSEPMVLWYTATSSSNPVERIAK